MHSDCAIADAGILTTHRDGFGGHFEISSGDNEFLDAVVDCAFDDEVDVAFVDLVAFSVDAEEDAVGEVDCNVDEAAVAVAEVHL